jgi:hypothetical protein
MGLVSTRRTAERHQFLRPNGEAMPKRPKRRANSETEAPSSTNQANRSRTTAASASSSRTPAGSRGRSGFTR